MNSNLYKETLLNTNYGFMLCEISESIDYELTIIENNKAFAKIFNTETQNINGRQISTLIDEQNFKPYISLLKQIRSIAINKQSKSTEFYSESNRKWYKINSFIYQENTVTFLVEEISKYKSKNVEHESFFALNLDLLCVADIDGYFLKLNQEWEATLGYTIEELEGRKFYEFLHPDDLIQTIEAIKSLSKNNDLKNFVNRYRCKDGSYKWIEWRSKPNGRLLFAAARDITEKIKKEKELNDLIEKYNQLLDQK